jgi:trehalose 6-phosphate phosphatase
VPLTPFGAMHNGPAPISLKRPPLELLNGASLFLDFDGTLVELAARPDAVSVDARLRAVLGALGRALDGRLAIVSGRSVAQIRELVGDDAPAISGSHGVEIEWADGRRRAPAPAEWLEPAVARMQAFSEERPGVLVEVKPFGVALHYRQAPDAEEASHELAASLAQGQDVHIQRGKMMVELRVAGADKGDAVRAFMADPAMVGTTPLFFGDDLTDEPAFVAAGELGGAGVLVGAERDSAAHYRLGGVGETLDWLDAAAGARA